MRNAMTVGLLLVSITAMAAEPVAFNAEAKVTLDASGKPLLIEASPDLPDPIRQFIERKIATWQFTPPTRDGKIASGVTYLSLGACAVPIDGGYRMAVDFKHNGPKIATGPFLMPPAYPHAAKVAGRGATLMVKYIVEPDGQATLESIERTDGPNDRRDGFVAALRGWVAAMRYVPEQFDGKPVRTRIQVPVKFSMTDDSRAQFRQELSDRARRSAECQIAGNAGEGLQPVAMDSPIQVLPAG